MASYRKLRRTGYIVENTIVPEVVIEENTESPAVVPDLVLEHHRQRLKLLMMEKWLTPS